MVLGNEEHVSTWTNDADNLRILQNMACNKLLKFLLRNRTPIEPTCYRKPYKWNQVIENLNRFN